MKTELFYLALVTALTGVLWVPYILDRIITWGLVPAVSYPANPPAQSPWAQRLMKAHANAVENLVVFATLVLVANAMGITGGVVATASIVYFWTRVVHAVAYTFAIPPMLLRTIPGRNGILQEEHLCFAHSLRKAAVPRQ